MSRIKYLRQSHGWTQEELGRKLNLQKSAISKYEKGIVTPSGEVLKRLSAIFNVSTDYLLDNEVASTEKFSDDETGLIYDYRRIDSDGKNLILGMMRRLREVIPPRSNKKISKNNSENGSNYGVVGGNFSSNVTIG